MLTWYLPLLALGQAVQASPRFQREIRQVQSASSEGVCPTPQISYVPILTTIPACTQGNLCSTATIISQGQAYTTSTLETGSISVAAAGTVIGATTTVNTGTVPEYATYPTFAVCQSRSCTLGGSVYATGTVFYSTSTLVQPSATQVVGGQTLAPGIATVTIAAPLTSSFYSTVVNGVTVTDGSQLLTTVTAGPDGVSTTVIQAASQVVISLQNAATPNPASSNLANTIIITVIVPGSSTDPAVTVTGTVTVGSDGLPTTSFGAGVGPAAMQQSTSPSTSSATTVAPPAGGSGAPLAPSTSLSNMISSTSSGLNSAVSSTSASTSSLPFVAANITVSNGETNQTGVSCLQSNGCLVGLCTNIGLLGLGADVGICIPFNTAADSSSLGASTITTPFVPATVTIGSGASAETGSSCIGSDGCLVGLCTDVGLVGLGANVGVCISSGLTLLNGTASVGVISASVSTTAFIPATVIVSLGTAAPSQSATSCASDSDCTVGVCADIGLLGLGAGVGACVLPTSSSSGSSITPSTASASASATSCTSDSDCTVGVCADIGLLGLGAGVGACVLPTSSSSGSSITPSTASASASATSCTSDSDCTVGVCADIGLLGLGANVGACALPTASAISSISSTTSAVVVPTTGSQIGASCTSDTDCTVGVCADIGLTGLGANIGTCVLPTSSSGSDSSMTSTTAAIAASVTAAACTSDADCTIGVCAQIGVVQAGVGACVIPVVQSSSFTTSTIPATTVTSATSAASASSTSQQCTSDADCTVGLCANIGLVGLGANVGLCADS